MRLIIILHLVAITYRLSAQNKISGVVTDANTGEPIAFANVFFTNTTFGSSTNEKGEYSFSGFPAGKYDLTFAFVGYVTTQTAVQFEGSTQLRVHQKMTAEAKVLNEVLVKPDTLGWKRNYEQFKYHFLGTSKYAAQCVILNPKDIAIFYDRRDGVLVAFAKKPIVVENNATGYRIKYYLHHFEFQSRTGLFNIYGLPQFEEMIAKNERTMNRWMKERQRIYEGSLLHFIRSWRAGTWIENDFKVARMYRVANKERPDEMYLNKKISEWQKKLTSREGLSFTITTDGTMKNGDSLSYFLRLRNMPKEIDSVAKESLTGTEFNSTQEDKNYQGLLSVRYDRLEDIVYTQTIAHRDQRLKQKSVLHVLAPVKIYTNGYYEDVRSIYLERYWSWSEKIATMLPLEFEPVKD